MEILKKNIKIIIAFALGIVLTGGIAYAAVSARQISYETNKNSEIKNVSDALNDLYSKSTKTQIGTFWFPTKENAKGLNKLNSSSRIINAKVSEQSNFKAIVLEKGIEYKIFCDIRTYCDSGHEFEFGLYDVKNNRFVLSKSETYTGSAWRNLRAEFTYTPDEDLNVVYAYDMRNASGYSQVARGTLCINTNEKNIEKIDEIEFNGANINGTVYPTIKSSNNVLEKPNSTSVKLLANKTYRITYKYVLNVPDSTWGALRLWNFTTNSAIDTSDWTTGYLNPEYTVIYPTTTDTLIGLSINRDGGSSNGSVINGTKIVVEEIK